MIAHSWVARCILVTLFFVMYKDLYNALTVLYQEVQDIFSDYYSRYVLFVICSSISRAGGMVSSVDSASAKSGSIPEPATIAFGEK